MKYQFSIEQKERMAANPWLTDRERSTFELHYRRGLPIFDVAAELDVSPGTVKNDLKSIRNKTFL